MPEWLPIIESAHLPPRLPITPPAGWRGYLTPRWLRFRYERFLERIGAERLWQHTATVEPERIYLVPGVGVVASPEATAAMRVVGVDMAYGQSWSRWLLHPSPLVAPRIVRDVEPPPIADWSTLSRLSLGMPPFRHPGAVVRRDIS